MPEVSKIERSQLVRYGFTLTNLILDDFDFAKTDFSKNNFEKKWFMFDTLTWKVILTKFGGVTIKAT